MFIYLFIIYLLSGFSLIRIWLLILMQIRLQIRLIKMMRIRNTALNVVAIQFGDLALTLSILSTSSTKNRYFKIVPLSRVELCLFKELKQKQYLAFRFSKTKLLIDGLFCLHKSLASVIFVKAIHFVFQLSEETNSLNRRTQNWDF
jgi:hypothetical protein